MKLYIDESGNTGPINLKNLVANFTEQPYYILAGILLSNKEEEQLNNFINVLINKNVIQSNELKAKNLYTSNSEFIIELVDYLSHNNFKCFVELMAKKYYMNTQILEAIIIPSNSLPLTNESIIFKNFIASNLSNYLSDEIYEKFCATCQAFTKNEFEDFLQLIKSELSIQSNDDIRKFLFLMVNETEDDYLRLVKDEPELAFKSFLPIPDKKHNLDHVFMLPNYHAFSNLIGRVNLFVNKNNLDKFEITHDEQKQFDIIYHEIIKSLQIIDTNQHAKDTFIQYKADFKIDNDLVLNFEKSENNRLLQIADILSGFIMRYYKDFENKNVDILEKYKRSIINLFSVIPPTGVNLVIRDQDFNRFMNYLYG